MSNGSELIDELEKRIANLEAERDQALALLRECQPWMPASRTCAASRKLDSFLSRTPAQTAEPGAVAPGVNGMPYVNPLHRGYSCDELAKRIADMQTERDRARALLQRWKNRRNHSRGEVLWRETSDFLYRTPAQRDEAEKESRSLLDALSSAKARIRELETCEPFAATVRALESERAAHAETRAALKEANDESAWDAAEARILELEEQVALHQRDEEYCARLQADLAAARPVLEACEAVPEQLLRDEWAPLGLWLGAIAKAELARRAAREQTAAELTSLHGEDPHTT